jgi:hypothetical protein
MKQIQDAVYSIHHRMVKKTAEKIKITDGSCHTILIKDLNMHHVCHADEADRNNMPIA